MVNRDAGSVQTWQIPWEDKIERLNWRIHAVVRPHSIRLNDYGFPFPLGLKRQLQPNQSLTKIITPRTIRLTTANMPLGMNLWLRMA